jgi:hypothetical protein
MMTFRASVEISFEAVSSTDIARSRFGHMVEERFNQAGPFHHKSCGNSIDADSPRKAQSAGFSFDET